MKPIRLTAKQNSMMPVHKDSVLYEAKTFTEEEIQKAYEADEDLYPMMLSLIRRTVGRFMFHWEMARPFEDDMTCEGLYALANFLEGIDREEFEGRTVMSVAFVRIRDRIEHYLNDNLSVVSGPSLRNRYYNDIEDAEVFDVDLLHEEKHPEAEGDEWKRDILEAIDVLRERHTQDDLDVAILSRPYWGASDTEIAEEYGVSRATVWDRRSRLRKLFNDLVR